MRTDTSYSPDEGSDTQSIVLSNGQENNKKIFPSQAAALDHATISDRNATYLHATVISVLIGTGST